MADPALRARLWRSYPTPDAWLSVSRGGESLRDAKILKDSSTEKKEVKPRRRGDRKEEIGKRAVKKCKSGKREGRQESGKPEGRKKMKNGGVRGRFSSPCCMEGLMMIICDHPI